jgi:site-specific recombinase
MGSLGTLGLFLGLPLDIRHITFAAGNFALGLVGNSWQVSTYMVAASIIGIGVIGFINFIVSFTLSLGLAMRSRGIPLGQLIPISKAVWAKHLEEPASFYFPPRNGADTDASEGVMVDAKKKEPEPQVANKEGASK